MRTATKSRVATSLFVAPPATRVATWYSRGVSRSRSWATLLLSGPCLRTRPARALPTAPHREARTCRALPEVAPWRARYAVGVAARLRRGAACALVRTAWPHPSATRALGGIPRAHRRLRGSRGTGGRIPTPRPARALGERRKRGELALGIVPPTKEDIRLDQVRSGRDDRRLTESTLCELAHDGLESRTASPATPRRGGATRARRDPRDQRGVRQTTVRTRAPQQHPRARRRHVPERRRVAPARSLREETPSRWRWRVRLTRRVRHAPGASGPPGARDLRAQRGSMEVDPPHLHCERARSLARRSGAHGRTARATRTPARGMRSRTAPRSPPVRHCRHHVDDRAARLPAKRSGLRRAR